jgi:isocitrate/isopropylmalate dehydrogenase
VVYVSSLVLVHIKAHVLQASIDAHGIPLTDEALNAAKSADAVLLGAIGGPVRLPEKCVVGMV